jgi:hypothetical protein
LFACLGTFPGIVSAQIRAPEVTIQGILPREKIERNEVITLILFVTNKSSVPLVLGTVKVLSEAAAEESRDFSLPIQVAPFSTAQGKISLSSTSDAKFGVHKLVVSADYFWRTGKDDVVSTETITVPLEITRKFEEEAKGFPGGTAAFLYLLLPVIPAFLSFQIFEQWRNGEKLKLPEFETKHIVPFFLAAIVVSFLMVIGSSNEAGINYSDPTVFIEVLFISLLIGAAASLLKWAGQSVQMKRWEFSQDDDGATYLRKALRGPRAPKHFEWVTGTVKGETWKGFLLQQPNGDSVLLNY